MKRFLVLLCAMLLIFGTAGFAGAEIIYTSNDWAYDSDAGNYVYGATDNYICEKGSYEAYFTFDLSALPDSMINSPMTFNASMELYFDAERTVWDGDTLIGSEYFYSSQGYFYETINIGTWLGDDSLTLTLTGPANGEHFCARVQMEESGNPAYLNIAAVPEPATLLFLGLGLVGLAGIRRKCKN